MAFGGAAALALGAACGGGTTPSADAAAGGPDADPSDPDAAAGGPDADPGAPDATPASCLDDGGVVAISGNHGHALVVSAGDVADGAEKTYDIDGDAGHGHTVTITAGQFAQLAAGTTIQVTSSNTGHAHPVTISCA